MTIPYGATTASGTFHFTYHQDGQLIRPKLSIFLDNQCLAGFICEGNEQYLPATYTFNFTQGDHTVKFELSDLDDANNCESAHIWQTEEANVHCNITVRVRNIFDGGIIHVNDLSSNKSSPYGRPSNPGDYFQIGAIDQSNGGYDWIWNTSGVNNSKWQRQVPGLLSDISTSRNSWYSVQSNDNSTQVIAGLRNICLVTFQNNFASVGNGGIIQVNGSQANSPTSPYNVTESNPITADGLEQTINSIDYYFDHWSDGSTAGYHTFYPNSTNTYTAYFEGHPNNIAINFGWDNVVNQPIKFHWTDNPNPHVTQYQIWRKRRVGGSVIDTLLLATVGRGVQTYTDYDYMYSRGNTDNLLWYMVKQYY